MNSINIFVANTYRSLGCWKDYHVAGRAIPTLEGKSLLLDGTGSFFWKARRNPIQKCFEVASSLGYSVFAIQDGGWCSSSTMAGSTYNKYGPSSECSDDGEGGTEANEVYEILNGKFVILAGCTR